MSSDSSHLRIKIMGPASTAPEEDEFEQCVDQEQKFEAHAREL